MCLDPVLSPEGSCRDSNTVGGFGLDGEKKN